MSQPTDHKEYPFKGVLINGFIVWGIIIAIFAVAGCLLYNDLSAISIALGIVLVIAGFVMMGGFLMLEPNQAAVMIFFGRYKGTFAKAGYYWHNPFLTVRRVSLRIDNLDIEPIKVNDLEGNPVLIGMVLVWRIADTYKVIFDLNSNGAARRFAEFVEIQGNAALREVAGKYPYDNDGRTGEITLRSGGEEINELLEQKINDRLSIAGIEVLEARINYLAYAPEIAAVMLRRQQAAAIIAAREKIVEGAVTTVKMALNHLEESGAVALDNEVRARIIGNLLVVLCADEAAQPVIPTT